MACRYLCHLEHKGCVASAKINQLLVFGDRNLSGPFVELHQGKRLHMGLCFKVEGFVPLLIVILLMNMVDISWLFGILRLHDFGTSLLKEH